MFDKYVHKAFPKGNAYQDPNLMLIQFNELFDIFIENDTLKQFYRKRARLDIIRNDNISKPAPNILELHSKYIFNTNGELKSDSVLGEIMKVFPLNTNVQNTNGVLIDRNILINMIQNINQTSVSNDTILLKNF